MQAEAPAVSSGPGRGHHVLQHPRFSQRIGHKRTKIAVSDSSACAGCGARAAAASYREAAQQATPPTDRLKRIDGDACPLVIGLATPRPIGWKFARPRAGR